MASYYNQNHYIALTSSIASLIKTSTKVVWSLFVIGHYIWVIYGKAQVDNSKYQKQIRYDEIGLCMFQNMDNIPHFIVNIFVLQSRVFSS